MRQFVIPQFIDVETKIIGFITVRQFVILIIGGFFIFLSYKLCDFALFLVLGIIIFALTGTLAFLKINGRPVHYFLINFFETLRKPKLKIWYKEWSNAELTASLYKPKEPPAIVIEKKGFISQSRLAELSLMVDTGGVYKGREGK